MGIPTLEDEFLGVTLRDRRRQQRLAEIALVLQAHPEDSFPHAFPSQAALEGFYRFLQNPACTYEKILQPHILKTVARTETCPTTLVLHDSTEIVHAAGHQGQDFYSLGGHFGYLAQVGLAVDFPSLVPLGVAHLECVERKKQPPYKERNSRVTWNDPEKESLRWARGVEAVEQTFAQAKVIHVADREGDSYELLSVFSNHRFVVRARHDRYSGSQDKSAERLFTVATHIDPCFGRTALLSARKNAEKHEQKHPTRPARVARLQVCAFPIELRCPASLASPSPQAALRRTGKKKPPLVAPPDPTSKEPHETAQTSQGFQGSPKKELPSSLKMNVVSIQEIDPPAGEEPIHWLLYTSEPIETGEQIAAIVDIYRARWLIEEFFKALKTGCSFRKRQFETKKSSQTALALLLPQAWRLLLLRQLSRSAPNLPATTVLNRKEIEVLSILIKKPLKKFATLGEVVSGFAKLGGHLPHNGPPGWEVLGRGWQKLLDAMWVSRCLEEAQMRSQEANDG